jgi:hypothetical protein
MFGGKSAPGGDKEEERRRHREMDAVQKNKERVRQIWIEKHNSGLKN